MSPFQWKIVGHIKYQEELKLNEQTINGFQHWEYRDGRIIKDFKAMTKNL